MKKTLIGSFVLLLVLFAGAAIAEEITIFGPEQYDRTKRKPNVYTGSFTSPSGAARILVTNGDEDGSHRISSARIILNGNKLFGPRDFNQNVANLSADIQLEAQNTLKVFLKSNPKKSRKNSHKKS